MTTTYDPRHDKYADEHDLRGEIARVFSVCNECRLCTSLCSVFPAIGNVLGNVDGGDAGLLTPDEQDSIVDSCHQCNLCVTQCPYVPGSHAHAIDFPALVVRQRAMRIATGEVSLRERAATMVLGRADALGRAATRLPAVANRIVNAAPGSLARAVLARVTGVSSVRVLPPYARQRFTSWMSARTGTPGAGRAPRASAVVYPTCTVEYQQPSIGRDTVRVLEHNAVSCSAPSVNRCCGAPFLHSGDVKAFAAAARRNVEALAPHVRAGEKVVVLQPTCAMVMKRDYVSHGVSPDAELVAGSIVDPCEFLMGLHGSPGQGIETTFPGRVPAGVALHVPCHSVATGTQHHAAALLALTGTSVTQVQRCAGIDGLWGLKAGNEGLSMPMARDLAAGLGSVEAEVSVGGCHMANHAVAEASGPASVHPMRVLAEAYGLPVDDD